MCCAVSQVLARCAEFFIEHGQNDKAVGLFILGKKYSQVSTYAKGQESRQGPGRKLKQTQAMGEPSEKRGPEADRSLNDSDD